MKCHKEPYVHHFLLFFFYCILQPIEYLIVPKNSSRVFHHGGATSLNDVLACSLINQMREKDTGYFLYLIVNEIVCLGGYEKPSCPFMLYIILFCLNFALLYHYIPLCDSRFTSIYACGVWGTRAKSLSLQKGALHTHTHTHIYIYIYIYI